MIHSNSKRWYLIALSIAGIVAAQFVCAQKASEKASQETAPAVAVPDRKSPFVLRLEIDKDLRLQATLLNHSSVNQKFLYDANLQPVELVLMDTSVSRISSFDTRSIAKFDRTVYRSAYRSLTPGKSEGLLAESFKHNSGFYTLRWGPYVFEHIAPGSYKAHLLWKSSLDSWMDSESHKTGKIKEIWKGAVESNVVTVELKP